MDAMAAELGKVPPQQLEAEQSVLGGILLDSGGLPAALEVLKGDEFYRDTHRVIFQAIQELFERNATIDLLTVCDHLGQKNLLESVGGAAYLASLAEAVP
ncbi:MAG TPA: replicative DNA helicase, partial [Syntrophobacteraceae bacterium]|nr:replicative DNA helicase [Syntrophobacteraceae bacterium]